MTLLLSELVSGFESLWPLEGAEDWDAPGLVCGSTDSRISRVLLAVDITSEIVEEALNGEFDLILAHHPFLMRGVTSVSENMPKGSLISKLIRGGVSVYAAHTNADIVENGVSDTLAKSFGLRNLRPLTNQLERIGHGRIGELEQPMTLLAFARLVASVLPATASGVRVAGAHDTIVQRIALCGGAGDSFIGLAADAAADVYVSSDLRHHVVQDARESAILEGGSPAIIDVSHWAAEWLWLEVAASQLGSLYSETQFVVSAIRTDPWDFTVTQ